MSKAEYIIADLEAENARLRQRTERAEAERDAEIARVVRLTERLGAETLRAERAEAAIERVRALHPDNGQFFCYRCRVVSPCRTLRALEVDA